MLKQFYKKVKHLVNVINMHGIPVPMVRDPKTGIGSVSLTLVFISSVLVIVGCAGKWSGLFGAVDFHEALEFFYASSALYFGRNFGKKSGAPADDEDEDEGKPSKVKVDNPDDPPSK